MHHRKISLTEFFLFSVWLRCSYTLQAPPPPPPLTWCAYWGANTHVPSPPLSTHTTAVVLIQKCCACARRARSINICCDRNANRALHRNSKPFVKQWGMSWKSIAYDIHNSTTTTTKQNEYNYDYMRLPFRITHYRRLLCMWRWCTCVMWVCLIFILWLYI